MINIAYIYFIFAIFLLSILIAIVLRRNKVKTKEKVDEPTQEDNKSDSTVIENEKIVDDVERQEEIERNKFEQEFKIEEEITQPEIHEDSIKTTLPQESVEDEKENLEKEFEIIHEETNEIDKQVVINPDELLNRFISYVNRNKLTKIEDLSNRLKSGKEETVDKLREIENNGNTVGFLDDKGIYMNLNEKELDVSKIY
jgi:hypothetical protein